MPDLNTFGEYVNHYRNNRKTPLNYVRLAEALGMTSAYVANVENNERSFSEEALEKFADLFDLSEIEFADMLLQKYIDQNNQRKGKKTLKNIKKLLPYYEKMLQGEIKESDIQEVKQADPIKEIYKNIERIKNPQLADLIKSTMDYGIQRFPG